MIKGQEFEFKGNKFQFDRYFQYQTPANSPVLIAAKRWIKSKQKFSGVVLLVGRKEEIEKEEG
jgi:hypothetical protein